MILILLFLTNAYGKRLNAVYFLKTMFNSYILLLNQFYYNIIVYYVYNVISLFSIKQLIKLWKKTF